MPTLNKWEILSKYYIDKGLKIFPVIANAKTPAIPMWQKDCSCEQMQILYWYETAKNCNWGLPCIENNLFVLDLDTHKEDENGVENYKKLCKDLGIEEPITLMQKTKSGGIHLIFKSDDDLKNVSGTANAFQDYQGIDLRNSNYIVVEPSVIDGLPYKFVNNVEPIEMPSALKEYIMNHSEKKGKDRVPYVKPRDIVQIGNRDEQVFAYLNDIYYKTRLDMDEISVLTHYFNETMLDEPLDDKVIDYKIKKMFEKDRSKCLFIKLPED